LIEKYLLSQNKNQFLNSIDNATDRNLLTLLVNPLPENYEDIFKELKIPSNVQSELLSVKLMANIRN
jgi:hypothetical protein